ncbi:spermatogenesis associated 6-like protein isoform X3 [Cricetulus griseus]|uniref:Spermatogenesis associated 6-like protein isoform X3 n=1 Tax=Cricetulus griseus TaxID=10029 RepID=A0A9J7FLH4_CRIGR|nr:spermatogenesis associated 6-like protein isoform X3 [Cricetulus griseus]XP_027262248.1 spermatogenesis associated 6-like protein isoform X3 [Cricetulus griseus]
MPLEVVVELHIRAISCPGVFLPDKESVYLGVYLLNQYLETDCFRSMFPIEIQQSMRFEKKFENAIDPGAVAEILESFLTRFELIQLVSPVWEELAYYEENTRNFLFPEPKLTSLHLGLDREVLMKTAIGFPEDNCKSQRLLFKSQRAPTNYRKMKPKEKSPDRLPKGNSSRVPTPSSPRRLLPHQPTPVNFGKSFGLPGERKPPFVVRHVDSENPFGESNLDHLLQKSRRKSKFFDFDIPVRRASSLESLATNIKVTREPDERILLRNQPPSPLDSRMSEKPIPSHQGDADFHLETPFSNTPRHSRSPSPLDKPPLQERSEASTHPLAWFQPHSQSTWEKIHESVCSLLTSHRAHPKEDFIPETNYICSRPSCPMKTFPQHGQRYF